MWIVVTSWDGYDVDIDTFPTEEEAREHFGSSKEHTSAKMYLAKVDETFNIESDN